MLKSFVAEKVSCLKQSFSIFHYLCSGISVFVQRWNLGTTGAEQPSPPLHPLMFTQNYKNFFLQKLVMTDFICFKKCSSWLQRYSDTIQREIDTSAENYGPSVPQFHLWDFAMQFQSQSVLDCLSFRKVLFLAGRQVFQILRNNCSLHCSSQVNVLLQSVTHNFDNCDDLVRWGCVVNVIIILSRILSCIVVILSDFWCDPVVLCWVEKFQWRPFVVQHNIDNLLFLCYRIAYCW